VALLEFNFLSNIRVKYQIDALTESYEDKSEYFIDRLSASLGKIAASRYPDPVIVRATNLDSEEFRGLLGGELFEKRPNGQKKELRGVHRFLHPDYKAAFALECEALRRVRQEIGFTNIHFMIPHNEEVSEAEAIIARLEDSGLKRGEGGFCIYLCCDFPSNVAYAADFASLFDGLSLDIRKLPRWLNSGQIPLEGGASRASQGSNSSMRKVLEGVNEACHAQDSTFTVRGRLLADASDLVSLFVDIGVDAISVNPEAIPNVTGWIAKAEEGKK
jgi:pyruvate,water dikinase